MKPKTRYNVRLALKKGVEVSIRDDEEAFNTFLELFFATVRRQNYFGRGEDYYKQIWKILQPAGKAKIAIASYEGIPLTAWMLFLGENVIYYPYGGSSDQHRNLMATYALVWEIIRWGKGKGFKYLDLWGTLGPNAKESDKDFGFHRFKTGWGGEELAYVQSYDMVISRLWYNLFKLGNGLRWASFKLIRIFQK
jgi:peptidoglycan pentaglycine glycine transferase (the first glycine)